jgi:hypothetical protein
MSNEFIGLLNKDQKMNGANATDVEEGTKADNQIIYQLNCKYE